MISVCGQDLRDLEFATNGHQRDLIFSQVGHPRLDAEGGWSRGRSFGSIKPNRSSARVGLNSKQAASILRLARDVGRPIGSHGGISQGRLEAAIFRQVEGMAL